ncbi:hypothetical protein DLREEDagrD3_07760 [Denitratisoma sp. agr-D3]
MRSTRQDQRGVFLLEALIGILIFSIGAITMIALQANGIAAQTDAQYRIEAANLADQILGDINLNVNRQNATTLQASLAGFAHQTGGSNCNFSGAASANALVTAWVSAITTDAASRLPGATSTMQQIQVDTGTFNRVTVTLCWQSPADVQPRRHTVAAYIN